MAGETITFICPSRGRPANIAELLEAWHPVTERARLMVAVDADDPQLDGYRDMPWWGSSAHLAIGPPMRVGPLLNYYAPAIDADYTGFLGDDHRPRTRGWDARLAAALDRPGVAYGNDLFQGEALPTACLISGVIVRTLGYMAPPGMAHLYLDNFWKYLGAALGSLHYLDDVIIEHCHPHAGKAPVDDGYLRNNDPALYSADYSAWERFLASRWPEDLAALRKALA